MSIRRLVQVIAFLGALAISFSAPISGSTAYACPPDDGGGYC